MEVEKIKYYKVSIFKRTCIGTYPLIKTKVVDNKNEAFGYAILEEEKGNKILIEEVTRIYISNNK